ncbi:MAG: hypothetical protein ABI576_09695 [Flavobacterium sp.]
MNDYPQIFLPEDLGKALSESKYIKPNKPEEPYKPVEESNPIFFKLLLVFIGFALCYVIPIAGVLLIGFSIYLLFTNSEKKTFETAMRAYKVKYNQFTIDNKIFDQTSKMSAEDFNKYARTKAIEEALKKTKMPSTKSDYKKGASHDYFKSYLTRYFGEFIIEDATIPWEYKYHRYDYDDETTRTYITDFAYINREAKLCIAIEIDEPYSLINKEAIHLTDYKRNLFFINNNWIVIRFAEEQVVLNPHECCYLIRDFIKPLLENSSFAGVQSYRAIVPNIPKWTHETVKNLIEIDYRKSMLLKMKGKQEKEKLDYQKFIDMLTSTPPPQPM